MQCSNSYIKTKAITWCWTRKPSEDDLTNPKKIHSQSTPASPLQETPKEDTQDWGCEADEDEVCEDLDEEEDEEDDSQGSDTTSGSAAEGASPKTMGSRASSPESGGGGSGLWGGDAGDASHDSGASSSDPKHDRIQQLQRMLGTMRKQQTAKTFVSITQEFTFCFGWGQIFQIKTT